MLLEKQLSEKQIELLQAGAQIQSYLSPEESSRLPMLEVSWVLI